MQEAEKMSGQHILIVEDDLEFADLVGKVVSADGYRHSHAPDAIRARHVIEKEKVDLIVLDLMLPVTDGLTFCRELRGEGVATPIIMLTAKGDDFDRVLGLEMGADDYLPKPFHSRELVARIKAVLRRSETPTKQAPDATPKIIAFGEWRLDTGKRELISKDGVVVLLGSAEYELLVALLTWPQVVLLREKPTQAAFTSSKFERLSCDQQIQSAGLC